MHKDTHARTQNRDTQLAARSTRFACAIERRYRLFTYISIAYDCCLCLHTSKPHIEEKESICVGLSISIMASAFGIWSKPTEKRKINTNCKQMNITQNVVLCGSNESEINGMHLFCSLSHPCAVVSYPKILLKCQCAIGNAIERKKTMQKQIYINKTVGLQTVSRGISVFLFENCHIQYKVIRMIFFIVLLNENILTKR